MGGRGASSSRVKAKTSTGTKKQTKARQTANSSATGTTTPPLAKDLNGLVAQHDANVKKNGKNYQKNGDYDNNGNQNLLKYQNQTDDKTATFLGGTHKNVDVNDPKYNDGYVYYDNDLNRALLRMGVSSGTTVLSEKDFNAYLKQTGQKAMYRGWSSKSSADRFEKTKNNHVGNGRYGDGYYFAKDKSTARGYGPTIMRVALSPNARVVNLSEIESQMQKASPKLRSSLGKAGNSGTRTYSPNRGESQMALKMGYNVVYVDNKYFGGFYFALTNDALVTCKKRG